MSTLPAAVEQLGGLGTLGDLPLVVVSRGRRDPGFSDAMHEGWLAAHGRLAALSTRSTRITAERSGHMVNGDDPAIFAEAVRQVLATARSR